MTTKGYLAAVYKSAGVTVGGSTIRSLLTNGDFETGDLTGWTITTAVGAVTFTGTGLNDATSGGTYTGTTPRNYKVEVDRVVPTTTTWAASTAYALDDAVEPTTANGYYYVCTTAGTSDSSEPTWPTTEGATVTDGTVEWTCHVKADTFKWSDDGGTTWNATLVAMTGAAQTLDYGVTITFAAVLGHTLGDYWTFTAGTAEAIANAGYSEHSYGAKITDPGPGVKIEQTTTLDTALTTATRCVAYCWAKLPTTTTATLKISFLDSASTVLGSATKTISSNNPFYGDTNWGYWSVYADAPVDTLKVKVEIYSAANQVWYVDNCGASFLDQILGAYQLNLKMSKDAIPVDTFKTLTDNSGARSFILGLESVEFSSDTIWQGSETYSEVQNGTEVFAQVFFEDGTVKDRAEFWAVMNSKEYSADPSDAIKKSITLTATGRGANGSALIGLIKG